MLIFVRRSLLLLTALFACDGQIGARGASSEQPPVARPPSATPELCVPGQPPVTPRLRRLTFAQYDRTVQDVLGVTATPSAELGPEIPGMTPLLWAGIERAAANVAAAVVADGATFAAMMPCTSNDDACAARFVAEIGRRLYRRPLTPQEIARYTDVLWAERAELTENGTFEEGIGLLLEAMLQSPTFLLRIEASNTADGERILLGGYERATRIAYALWNAPPDDALLDAAEAGELDTPEGVRAQARRMLTSPEGVERSRAMMRAAHADWLGMRGAYAAFWSNTQRDPALYPEFVAGIDASFREEVLRFTDLVAFERNGSFADLFTSPVTQVNAELAPIYGLEGDYASWTTVELDPEERPGLLTRAGFVGTHGRYGRGSLIFRGAFVLKRMLCQETGSPPAGVDATPLPQSAELRTTRDRVEAMTAGQPCAGCHTDRINPAGFALEAFDGIGRHRTEEDGFPIDTTGVLNLDGRPTSFAGAKEYAEAIAASKEAQQCYVDRLTEFTFDREGARLDCGGGGALAAKLGDPNMSLTDFLVELVADDNFLYRATQEAP